MLIDQAKNPMHPELLEDIVTITMTRDQFHHLADCVTLAYQSAKQDSRMRLISVMMQTEFDVLRSMLERIVVNNAASLQGRHAP